MFHDLTTRCDDNLCLHYAPLPTAASDGSVGSQQHDARGTKQVFPASADQSTSRTFEEVLINVSLLLSPKKQMSKFPFVLLERCEVMFDELATLSFQFSSTRALLVCKFGSQDNSSRQS